MLQIDRIADTEGLAALRQEWAGLMDAAEDATVFQTHGWVSAWWDSFGTGQQLFVLVARAAGRTVGIVPLVIAPSTRWGMEVRTLRPIGEPWLDLFELIVAERREEVVAAVAGYLAAWSSEWDVASLRELPGSSETLSLLLDHLTRQGLRSEPSECSSGMVADLSGGWPAYEARLLADRYLRRVIRSKLRRLAAVGQLALVTVGGRAVEDHLAAFFEMHERRWRCRDGREDPLADPATRRFFQELARRLGPLGLLNFTALTLDERPIAYHLGYEYRGVLYQHVPTFDVAFAKYSPGLVLHYELLRAAAARGVRAFDFLRGEEHYKLAWGTARRCNFTLEVYHGPRFGKSWLLHGWRRVHRAAARGGVTRRASVLMARGAGSLWRRLFRREAMILLEWDGRRTRRRPARPVVIRRAGRRDAGALSALIDMREFLARLRSGDLCYVAECDGRIASMAWVSFGENFVREIEYRLGIAEGTAYVYHTHTLPEFRGRGIYSALIGHLLEEFGGSGYRLQILTEVRNTRALAIHRHLFGKEVARIELTKLFGVRVHRIDDSRGRPQ